MKTIAMAAAIAIVAAGGAAGMVIGGAGAQIAKTYTVMASNAHSATADVDRASAISPVANDATPGAAPLVAEPTVSAPEPAPAPRNNAASNLNMTTHVIPEQSVPALAPRTSLPRAKPVQTAVHAPAQPATQQPALRLVPPPVTPAPAHSGTHAVTRVPATTVAHTQTPAANDAAHQPPAAATRTRNSRRDRHAAPAPAAQTPVEVTPAPMIVQPHVATPTNDATHATTLSETHATPPPATEPAPQPPAAAPSTAPAQPAATPAPGPAANNGQQDTERHGLAAILFGSP